MTKNRQFEFRIWDGEQFNYFDFSDPIFMQDGSLALAFRLSSFDFNDEGSEHVFQQFTGLFDKNGKKIFEGDIIQTLYFGYSVVGTIEYVKDSFVVCGRYMKKNSVSQYFPCYGDMSYLEIIGNIFQNPELIK